MNTDGQGEPVHHVICVHLKYYIEAWRPPHQEHFVSSFEFAFVLGKFLSQVVPPEQWAMWIAHYHNEVDPQLWEVVSAILGYEYHLERCAIYADKLLWTVITA